MSCECLHLRNARISPSIHQYFIAPSFSILRSVSLARARVRSAAASRWSMLAWCDTEEWSVRSHLSTGRGGACCPHLQSRVLVYGGLVRHRRVECSLPIAVRRGAAFSTGEGGRVCFRSYSPNRGGACVLVDCVASRMSDASAPTRAQEESMGLASTCRLAIEMRVHSLPRGMRRGLLLHEAMGRTPRV